MKKFLSTIIATAVCYTVNGQQISQRQNSYRSSETLIRQRVDAEIDALRSWGQVIDFMMIRNIKE